MAQMQATKKRAEKLEVKDVAVDLKELLRMEHTQGAPEVRRPVYWARKGARRRFYFGESGLKKREGNFKGARENFFEC